MPAGERFGEFEGTIFDEFGIEAAVGAKLMSSKKMPNI